jgi:hypothetical protein
LCGDRHFWHTNVTENIIRDYMSDHFDRECDTVKATQVLAKTDVRPAEVLFVKFNNIFFFSESGSSGS